MRVGKISQYIKSYNQKEQHLLMYNTIICNNLHNS